jgi:calcium-dependent protein kinase
MVREILRTISQFHVNGVVIRDVKPENFLFASDKRDSHLKAIDFGIAHYCTCASLFFVVVVVVVVLLPSDVRTFAYHAFSCS